MPKKEEDLFIQQDGPMICAPLVEAIPTDNDQVMLIFPDYNVFAHRLESFTTRAGHAHSAEQLTRTGKGCWLWLNEETFVRRGDWCSHQREDVETRAVGKPHLVRSYAETEESIT